MLPTVIIPDEDLRAIGTLVVRFSHLETILDLILVKVLGASLEDSRAFIPFAGMTFTNKLTVLEALLCAFATRSLSKEPLCAYQSEIKSKLMDVNTRRNRYIHARWSYQDEKLTTLKIQALKGLVLEHKEVKLGEINKLCDDISNAINALWGLIEYSYKSHPTKGTVSEAIKMP